MKNYLLAIAALLLMPHGAVADDEASNRPHVATDQYGRCFAHTIPSERYGTAGHTDFYIVSESVEKTNSFPWYAPQLYISCNASNPKGLTGPALVQVGPWPRGHKPDDETLSLAFTFLGEKQAEYSTLDIADNDPANAVCSVSHYQVIEKIHGFFRTENGASRFRILTTDGRRLSFDPTTGELLKTEIMPDAKNIQNCAH